MVSPYPHLDADAEVWKDNVQALLQAYRIDYTLVKSYRGYCMVTKATEQARSELRYVCLARQLRQQIASGALKPGDRLPSHTASRALHGVTQSTLERAHAVLEQEGLIERRHRSGTFVSAKRAATLPVALADERTIIVIAGPHSFFERCVRPLFGQLQDANLTLVCRILDARVGALLGPPPPGQRPLGFLFFDYHLAALARQFYAAGCRVVLMGAPPPVATAEVPCVHADREQGGYLTARHLLDLGHRHIAFTGGADFFHTLRWRGNQNALREAERGGLISTTQLTDAEIIAWQREPVLAAAYFRRPTAPTGVVVWNDYEALKLMGLLSQSGVRVPDEVSVVGYDNLPEGEVVYPALTTVDQAIAQQLRAAVSLLTRPLAPPASHTVVVTPTLIQRASSGPAPHTL